MSKSVIKDDHQLFSRLLVDSKTAPQIYQPGPYWKPYQDRMIRRLLKSPIQNFRSEPLLGKGFADCIRPMPIDHDGLLRSRVVRFLTELPGVRGAFNSITQSYVSARKENASLTGQLLAKPDLMKSIKERGWPETTIGGCEATVALTLPEPKTSVKYLILANRLRAFERMAAAKDAKTYMEIGGGFGAFAHLLLTWRPAVCKIMLVDIPPVIYIATQYLKAHFGDAVRDYASLREGPITFRDDDTLEIICIPTWAIERVSGPIDLFHNAASFSEMTPEIVENYATLWRRLSGQKSVFWFFFNKMEPHETVTVTLPENIKASFDWLSFKRVDKATFTASPK